MEKSEKNILKAVVQYESDLLSPADLFNRVAHGNRRSVANLIARGYIEEVPQDMPGWDYSYSLNFYRATEKGLNKFASLPKKTWFFLKRDIRTIIISAISALVTSILTIYVDKLKH